MKESTARLVWTSRGLIGYSEAVQMVHTLYAQGSHCHTEYDALCELLARLFGHYDSVPPITFPERA